MSRVEDCKLIDLPKIVDETRHGSLTFVEENVHVPVGFPRVFHIYDVPAGESRGAHAHRTLHEILICLSGSFEVLVDDGARQKTFRLNRPWRVLHVPPMLWASEINFDAGSVCLVLASDRYDAGDYIRDYSAFLEAVRAGSPPR